MRITRSTLLTNSVTPAPPPPVVALVPPAAPRTRYGIRHTDGRWLALVHQDGRILPVWQTDSALAWSWPFATSAVCAALDVEQIDLPACGPWTVEAVPQ